MHASTKFSVLRHWRQDADHHVIGRIAIVGVDHDHFLGLFCANLRFVTKTYHVPSVLVPRLIAHHGLTGEEGLNAFDDAVCGKISDVD